MARNSLTAGRASIQGMFHRKSKKEIELEQYIGVNVFQGNTYIFYSQKIVKLFF